MNGFSFEATGTIWKVDIFDVIDEVEFERLKKDTFSLIHKFELNFSRFLPDSLISKLKNKTGNFKVTPEFLEILKIYFEFNEIAKGAFTPLIGQMLNDTGYDAEYSFKPKNIRNVPNLRDAIEIISEDEIKISLPVELDFGGVGKGYLIDKVSKFLSSQNVERFCVDGGGDMFYKVKNEKLKMQNELTIGLENPLNVDEVIGILNLKANKSVCSSSNNRRTWGAYSHIVRPDHKMSPKNILASWVVTPYASLSDTVATCLFFVNPEIIREKYDFEYLIIFDDFTIEKSQGFAAELF